MIFPTNSDDLNSSLIGLGSFVLENLQQPKKPLEIYEEFLQAVKKGEYPGKKSDYQFWNWVWCLMLLYEMGLIEKTTKGRIMLCRK